MAGVRDFRTAENTPATKSSPYPRFDALLTENAGPETSSPDTELQVHTEDTSMLTAAREGTLAASTAGTSESATIRNLSEQLSQTTLKNAEDELSSTDLHPADFADLSTPVFHDGVSGTESNSKTDYPMSGNFSSLVSSFPGNLNAGVISADMLAANSLENVSPPQNAGSRSDIDHLRFCVDLRGQEHGMHNTSVIKIPGFSQQDFKVDACAYFQCSEDEIHDIRLVSWPISLTIVRSNDDNVVLIVRYKKVQGCLLVSRDVSLMLGLSMCERWLNKDFYASSSSQLCLLWNGKRLDDVHAFSNIQDFEELELIKVETQTLKFVCRLNQYSEKVYYIDCNETDYIHEIQDKLSQMYYEDNQHDAVDPQNVWLTWGDKVIPPCELLRNVWNPKELQYSLESHLIDAEIFRVHFQPPDSVLVKLNFKSESKKYPLKSESVILLSTSRASPQSLRQEISKVIHKDPLSFKMYIHGRKIEMDMALEPFLQMANCTVVVEQLSQIRLNVESPASSTAPTAFPVILHRYERVETLKRHVSSHLNVPAYCVDLHRNEARLDEFSELRGSRLRHGDTIQALVLPNRIRVSVRLRPNHWEEVIISDVTVTRVAHLVAYAQTVLKQLSSGTGLNEKSVGQQKPVPEPYRGEGDPCPSGNLTFKVLLHGEVLAHGATLRETGVTMNSRLLLIREESLCYTSSCRGKVPIFWASDSSCYQPPLRVMAMCDGNQFYYAKPLDASTDNPELYETSQQLPSGLYHCSAQLKAEFPPEHLRGFHQPTTTPPPQSIGQTPQPYICGVCKSASVPSFKSSAALSRENQMSQSQSCNFSDQGYTFSSMGNRQAEMVMSSPQLHSTPVRTGSKKTAERSFDVCDGPSVYASCVSGHSANISGVKGQSCNVSGIDSPSLNVTGINDPSVNSSAVSGYSVNPAAVGAYFSDSASSPTKWFPHTKLPVPLGRKLTAEAGHHSSANLNPGDVTQQDLRGDSPAQPLGLPCIQATASQPVSSAQIVDQLSPDKTIPENGQSVVQDPISPGSGQLQPLDQTFRNNDNLLSVLENLSRNQQVPVSQSDTGHADVFSFLNTRPRHYSDCQSEGASRTSRKEVYRSVRTQQSVERDREGNTRIVFTSQIHDEQHISKDMLKEGQFPQNLGGFQNLCLPPAVALPALPASTVNDTCSPQPDRTFAYIKRKTIHHVAEHLGKESDKVMLQLLPIHEVIDLEDLYKSNSFRRNYAALVKWCQRDGSKASVSELKKVLNENGRGDLVEDVDAIEAKEQGYETAP